ncbi:MAG: hypothetical protein AMS24_02050 [Chlamydiae bacterium SM23_39]|nr:MAG: hypothetical protein AMS24_02050 [Chlamydiae bacterium SM23_39]
MKDHIFEKLKDFLDKNLKKEKKILLGYSGGFDSKVLLHLMLRYRNAFKIEFHIAHIDHRWRKNSSLEAEKLKKEAEKYNIPFHLKVLEKVEFKNNLEDKYRVLRINFFKELYEKYKFQALLLAHQKDDLAETVLKRFLEGAYFPSLKSMEEISVIDNMVIWRPLLSISKKDLKKWLIKNDLDAIDDETNRDERYLRAKLREKIIPYISLKFGKEITNNLYIASLRASELNTYLDKKTEKYFDMKVKGPFGIYLNLSKLDVEDIERKHLFRRIIRYLKLECSRDIIDRIVTSKTFSLNIKNCKIIKEKNNLFFLKKEIPKIEKMEIKEGIYSKKNWEINIKKSNKLNKNIIFGNWEDSWKGEISCILPEGSYQLLSPEKGAFILNKKLNKWYLENKVPSFLRFSFPVIYKDGIIFHEFLSGKNGLKNFFSNYYYEVFLRLRP